MSMISDRGVLHWLPVPQRIQSKVALTAFDCVRGSGPAYFTDVCIPVADISSRSNLRSAQRGDMVVSRTRTQLSRLECHPCLPPLNVHQSRTIQSCIENPAIQPSLRHPLRTFFWKSLFSHHKYGSTTTI